MGFFREVWNGLQVREEWGGESSPIGADLPRVAPPARERFGFSSADAFGISMVYRAISIHAISAKQMSIQEWREDVTSAFSADERLPTSNFLRRPDVNMPRSAFVEMSVVSLACSGNAYWHKIFDPYGRIVSVEVLNPNDMSVRRENGRLKYYYGNRLQPYEENEVQHLKLLRVPGSLYGLGPIQAARVELEGARDLRDYSSNWFREGSAPTGIISSDQILSPDQAKQAKDQFKVSQGGKRDVAVFGQGLHYEAMFLNPKDAQFLESMAFSTTQIARLFGTPSSLMLATVEGNSQTYQNVEQDWLGFIRFSNMQYLIEIEDALSQVLPRQHYAKFNIEALLRTDSTTRYAGYKSAIEAKWMFADEVRRLENLPPREAPPEPVTPAVAPVTEEVEEEANAE